MAFGVSTSKVLTLLGFCVSVLFIVFGCSRLVYALVRRRRSRSSASRPSPVSYSFAIQGQPAASAGGLNPAAVTAFPTHSFSDGGPRVSASSDLPDAATQ